MCSHNIAKITAICIETDYGLHSKLFAQAMTMVYAPLLEKSREQIMPIFKAFIEITEVFH